MNPERLEAIALRSRELSEDFDVVSSPLTQIAIKHQVKYAGELVSVTRWRFRSELPETLSLEARSMPALIFSRAGVIALHLDHGDDGKHILSSEGNLTLVPPGLRPSALLTPGDHTLDVLVWRSNAIPSLDRYLTAWKESRASADQVLSIHNTYVFPQAPEQLDAACRREFPRADFDLLALVLSIVPTMTSSPSRMAIAPNPLNLPDSVRDLVAQVKADPTRPWSLTEAASLAGYSSFHFSRVFKQVVGCGFHEFVDRSRTELAVEALTTTVNPLTIVAKDSGFPSLRAMRESLRDYLGLSVRDLRGLSKRAS